MWPFTYQAIVDGGFVNSSFVELQHRRFDLILGENQVANDHTVCLMSKYSWSFNRTLNHRSAEPVPDRDRVAFVDPDWLKGL
jgi:hypothetical protein